MLRTRSIPIYGEDRPEDWHRFIYKAAKGSIKAPDMIMGADLAYMAAITGDPNSPDTLELNEYIAIIREQFPSICPVNSIQHFHDLALECGWITLPFSVSEAPRHNAKKYVALWGRSPVAESALLNDAMLYCLDLWSVNHFIECVDHYDMGYDSRITTAAMLYLFLTWPAT